MSRPIFKVIIVIGYTLTVSIDPQVFTWFRCIISLPCAHRFTLKREKKNVCIYIFILQERKVELFSKFPVIFSFCKPFFASSVYNDIFNES